MPLPDGGDIKKIDLKPPNKDMMYEVWTSLLVALATACYRMDPTTINAKPWDGGQSSSLSAPNRNQEIALAKEEGLQADLKHLAGHILTPLARRVHPDLRVMFEYGDFDPEKEARIYEVRSKVDMTRNEVRMAPAAPAPATDKPSTRLELIKDVLERYESNLWNQPADPSFVNAYQQAAQNAAFADQGEEEEPPPGDGFGGGPNGEFPGAEPDDQGDGGPPMPGEPPGGPGAPGGPPGGPPGGGQFPFGQVPEDMQKGHRHRRNVTVYVHELD
jgi:hypothetical protein